MYRLNGYLAVIIFLKKLIRVKEGGQNKKKIIYCYIVDYNSAPPPFIKKKDDKSSLSIKHFSFSQTTEK